MDEMQEYIRIFKALGDRSRARILKLLEELNRQLGTTLLMVTHDAEAAQTAGRPAS